jgi:hypothetical protein
VIKGQHASRSDSTSTPTAFSSLDQRKSFNATTQDAIANTSPSNDMNPNALKRPSCYCKARAIRSGLRRIRKRPCAVNLAIEGCWCRENARVEASH